MLAVPAFEVLPAALVAAAAAVRSYGRDVGDPSGLRAQSGSAALDAAVADLAREVDVLTASLEERATASADLLQAVVEHLGELERVLVPRHPGPATGR
jgi:hypothetical protein